MMKSFILKYQLVVLQAILLIAASSCVNRDKKSEDDTVSERNVPVPDSKDSLENHGYIFSEDMIERDGEVFVVAEEQPEFPGGNAALMKFLADSIKYPTVAQEKGIEGRVICNFIIEKDGSLSDFQVIRSVHPLLDNEALRVLQLMPDWIPGKQSGENVRIRFTLPVVFRLQN